MKCAMNYDESEKLDLVHGLCKLFAEIDINGDKKMEWREFTQYVIDAVMQDSVKVDNRGELPNQKDMVELAHSKKFLRFVESLCTDSVIHETLVQKATYYPSLDRLLLVEAQSHYLKFVTPELKRKEFIDLFSKETDLYDKGEAGDESEKIEQPRERKYFVLAAAYDETNRIVLFEVMRYNHYSSHVYAAIRHFKPLQYSGKALNESRKFRQLRCSMASGISSDIKHGLQ